MAEKVVSKLRGNMWRLIILAVAGSLIYGLPYFRTYYYCLLYTSDAADE